MRIFLVRHGETDWNRERRLQGIRDVALNKGGLVQAQRLSRRFRDVHFSAILASPLARARQTALIIRRQRQLPVILDHDLREIDHGTWTGLTVRAIRNSFPAEYDAWQSNPNRVRPSTGEVLHAAYCRAAGFLSRILKLPFRGNVLVVSHGVTNALLLCAALGVPLNRMWEFPQPNGSIDILQFEHGPALVLEKRE